LFGDNWELIELPFLPDEFKKPLKGMFNHYGGKFVNFAVLSLNFDKMHGMEWF